MGTCLDACFYVLHTCVEVHVNIMYMYIYVLFMHVQHVSYVLPTA